MKIKFNSGDDLALNKTTEIPSMIIVVRAIKQLLLFTSFLRSMPILIINNIKTLCYDRIDVSGGIDINTTSESV